MKFLYRLLGALIGLVLVVAAFLLASVILGVVAIAGLGVWAWLWWRTRGLRKEAARNQGAVIEGEYRVEVAQLPDEQSGQRPPAA